MMTIYSKCFNEPELKFYLATFGQDRTFLMSMEQQAKKQILIRSLLIYVSRVTTSYRDRRIMFGTQDIN